MLKSTHQPRTSLAQSALNEPTPLPPGWTEHKAPTGHAYYYHADTKQSTYTRPGAPRLDSPTQSRPPHDDFGELQTQQAAPFLGPQGFNAGYGPPAFFVGDQGPVRHENGSFPPAHRGGRGRGNSRGGRHFQNRGQRDHPQDRPKSKQAIPGKGPWLLVKTKLGRQFVFNPDDNESFWTIPDDLKEAIEQVDLVGKEATGKKTSAPENLEDKNDTPNKAVLGDLQGAQPAADLAEQTHAQDSSDEYEEVEVTDDEDGDDENPSKRQKTAGEETQQPQEFNEDDIAFQLAAMGQDYDLDPGEYGDEGGEEENWEEGAEGLPLTEDDSTALFRDLLDDYHINPYSTWEKVVEEGRLVNDERYVVLPNMKARKEVWSEWSRDRIQVLKEQKEKMAKKDPRIPYLGFLQKNATPKLYWPEFKRKYKKEVEMRDPKYSDKDREKLYRDHISRLKLPETTLKSDLTALLKSQPLSMLNQSTSSSHLPPSILTDLRYISLPPSRRDPLIDAYISTLAPAPTDPSVISVEEDDETRRRRTERERREKALAERERQVAAEKRRQRGQMEYGRHRLREGEEEIERAMRVGKEGLRTQLTGGAGGATVGEPAD
ncbi:MAG: hypothetical protein M1817_003184 [Caeruleum heppii]|nr:MAG: hypothetical protein M1817_003184 [Caeruleum heppii]